MEERRKKTLNRWLTVLHVIGILLIIEGVFMLISLIPSYIYGGSDAEIISLSALFTICLGTGLFFTVRKSEVAITRKQGFVIVALIWIVMSCCGALPLYLGHYVPSFTDAFFETMSGFTTTGATILSGVESIPKGILFWRSFTHWIGGIGIVVIVLSFIPFIGGGGMALFAAEVAGPDKSKISPHTEKTGKILIGVYSLITFLCIITYWACGMNFYDAICHAFSTMGTGGFSTKNDSAANFTPLIQYAMILFMTLGGTNLLLVYYSFKGNFFKIKRNEEIRTYLLIILVATLIIFLWTYDPHVTNETTLRNALFQVVSFMTTTGFVSCDYNYWATPAIIVLIMVMFSGAMSGSTTGGLKVVRIVLLMKNANNIIKKGIHSNAFIPIKLDGKVVSDDVIYNVVAMFILYLITLCIGILLLVANKIQLEEAIICAVSSISNVGPGFGQSGGFGNFAHFPDVAKWTLAMLMYVGRLEIVTVFVILTPSFWKR